MAALEVVDLQKSFGALDAVRGVGFSIEPGEIFGLLGPNGAGKSTTINIIAGLIEPDGGSVRVGDAALGSGVRYRWGVGYVPQEISLAEKLTAIENLKFVGRLYDLGGRALGERVGQTLEAVGLSERGGDRVETFSGGMKRRLNIAAALLHEPRVVLMDEPTAGVDPQARAYIFDIVCDLARRGCAILYTTHYMEEAERLCTRTAIIDHGRVLAMGTLAELTAGRGGRCDLAIEAPGLSDACVQKLADRLGSAVWTRNGNTAHLHVFDGGIELVEMARIAAEAGLRPTALSLRPPNLETVFLELTGHALRE